MGAIMKTKIIKTHFTEFEVLELKNWEEVLVLDIFNRINHHLKKNNFTEIKKRVPAVWNPSDDIGKKLKPGDYALYDPIWYEFDEGNEDFLVENDGFVLCVRNPEGNKVLIWYHNLITLAKELKGGYYSCGCRRKKRNYSND